MLMEINEVIDNKKAYIVCYYIPWQIYNEYYRLFSNVFSVIMGIFFMINNLASKEILARLTLRILMWCCQKTKLSTLLMSGKSSWIRMTVS